ncbi:HAD family hydrolase [Roseivirga thermotolerans]|uniref:HAD family hydrolase n=1 Tax=Roseivirga thermotolerans TaxID=1758176 RepID=UPI00273F7D2E|nr:HAD family hydrolase [Roseivirga thermotolerans]
MPSLTTIAFDADDTLWVNEPIFTDTRLKFEAILSDYMTIDSGLEKELYAVEIRNLQLFGYGIKGFTLSMIETALELTDYALKGRDVERIIRLGKEMLQHPVQVLPGVEEVLDELENHYRLMVITKGDLWDQENKIARSNLDRYFSAVEIVSEKDTATYAALLKRHQLTENELLMVGNSLKSDIIPLLDLGAQAIHIPFHDTWAHEQLGSAQINGYKFPRLTSISELPGWLKENAGYRA